MLRRELVLVAGLTIALVGCAAPAPVDIPGAPPTGATPALPATPGQPSTPTPAPATAPPDTPPPATPTPAPAATPVSGEANVSVFDFGYTPASIEVTAGTSVTWTNDGVVPHTVTFEVGPDSGTMDGGAMFEHTFDAAGQFSYICRFHPAMRGTITVGP